MDARSSELAWAAGIFDGEGSTSTYLRRERKTPRRQIAVSQGGVPGEFPAVLVRFMSIVGVGNITGPYDGLYYWKTTRKDAVDSVGAMLWPYLSYEKRRQFEAAALRMKRPVPAPIDDARVLTPDSRSHGRPAYLMGKARSRRIPRRAAPLRGGAYRCRSHRLPQAPSPNRLSASVLFSVSGTSLAHVSCLVLGLAYRSTAGEPMDVTLSVLPRGRSGHGSVRSG